MKIKVIIEQIWEYSDVEPEWIVTAQGINKDGNIVVSSCIPNVSTYDEARDLARGFVLPSNYEPIKIKISRQ